MVIHRWPLQGLGAQEVGGTPAYADKQVASMGCQIKLRGMKRCVLGHHGGDQGCRVGVMPEQSASADPSAFRPGRRHTCLWFQKQPSLAGGWGISSYPQLRGEHESLIPARIPCGGPTGGLFAFRALMLQRGRASLSAVWDTFGLTLQVLSIPQCVPLLPASLLWLPPQSPAAWMPSLAPTESRPHSCPGQRPPSPALPPSSWSRRA